MAKESKHVGMRNGSLFCFNCGGEKKLVMPIAITEMTKIMDHFSKIHAQCPKTWEQPMPAPDMRLRDRMYFWLDHGERGVSSETIFDVMENMNIRRYKGYGHPVDPDDFRRCHLLLEMIPEWRKKLHLLESLSPVWKNLVAEWDNLTTIMLHGPKETKNEIMYKAMKDMGC